MAHRFRRGNNNPVIRIISARDGIYLFRFPLEKDFVMTYSIVARCPKSGRFGVAVASYSICVGLYCDGAVRSRIGASFTQGFFRHANNRLAMNLVEQGHTAKSAMNELLANDSHPDYRHIAMVDREGVALVHAGDRLDSGSSFHVVGEGYAVLGDGVAGIDVVNAMSAAFLATEGGELEERFFAVLEKGRDAGGIKGKNGTLPARSVAVVVFGNRDFSDLDLRVDMHGEAVAELQRLYTEYKPHEAYYLQRALSPRNAIPSMEFADMLKRGEVGK